MAGSAEIGAVAETDAALFELGVRVVETKRGDIEPHKEASLRALAAWPPSQGRAKVQQRLCRVQKCKSERQDAGLKGEPGAGKLALGLML